jgi:predicted DsbA family dithiol-disulfide isomerase
MRVDVWSDVACPWCFIGLANLQLALDDLRATDELADVEVVLHSFQLDPGAPPRDDTPLEEALARKYGATVEQIRAQQERIAALGAERGIDFRFDRTIQGNTFDAHRLLHLGRVRGVQLELKQRLGRAYFTDGEALGEAATLRRAALDVGLDEHEIDALLEGDAFADEVRDDLDAARRIGVTGVPFFVVDGRLGVAGAQPPEALADLVRQAAGAN